MKNNLGTADQVIRLLLSVGLLALFLFEVVTGPIAIAALAVSAVFMVTSIVGTCPLYMIVGLSTCPAGGED